MTGSCKGPIWHYTCVVANIPLGGVTLQSSVRGGSPVPFRQKSCPYCIERGYLFNVHSQLAHILGMNKSQKRKSCHFQSEEPTAIRRICLEYLNLRPFKITKWHISLPCLEYLNLRPFKITNDIFPYPSIHLHLWNPYPFIHLKHEKDTPSKQSLHIHAITRSSPTRTTSAFISRELEVLTVWWLILAVTTQVEVDKGQTITFEGGEGCAISQITIPATK